MWSHLSHFSLYSSDFLHAPIFPQNMNTLFYYFCLKNDSIMSFGMWKGGWWMWRDGGCEGRLDVLGGWMWRNHQSGGCSISQYDHISAIFHCIALIVCMHQYFFEMWIPYFITFVSKIIVSQVFGCGREGGWCGGMVDVEGGWMCREGRCVGRVDLEKSSVWWVLNITVWSYLSHFLGATGTSLSLNVGWLVGLLGRVKSVGSCSFLQKKNKIK